MLSNKNESSSTKKLTSELATNEAAGAVCDVDLDVELRRCLRVRLREGLAFRICASDDGGLL